MARVSTLGAATVVSQSLGFLALVLLTRALSPSQIGVYQVFQSRAALVASVSLLSYHSVLPHLDEPTYRTLSTALLAWNVLVAGATAGILTLLGTPLALQVGGQIMAAGFTSVAEMSNIRHQRSHWIAAARLTLSTANVLWVVAAVRLLQTSSIEIVVTGQVLLAVLVGAGYATLTLRDVVGRVALRALGEVLAAKRNCALYYAPAELLGSVTMNLPTLLIERYFGLGLAGQFGVVLRFCGAPVTILSVTIGHVYHGALAHAVRERAEAAYANFRRLRAALAAVGGMAGVTVLAVVPWLILRVLGDGWREAADIARALSPMYAAMIWVSPLTATFQVFEAQRAVLLLQLSSAIIAVVAFVLAGAVGRFWLGIGLYSALVSARWLLSLATISRMSRERLLPAAREP